MYEEDVHRGLTEWLALVAGFDPERARQLGEAAQRPDDDPARAPVENGGRCILRDEASCEATETWHFPFSPSLDGKLRVIPNSDEARAILEEGIRKRDLEMFGEGLHPYEDSWSHRDEPALGRAGGHSFRRSLLGFLSTKADHTHEYPLEAHAMAQAVLRRMDNFRVANGEVSAEEAEQLRDRIESDREIYWILHDFIVADTKEKKEHMLFGVMGVTLGDYHMSLPSTTTTPTAPRPPEIDRYRALSPHSSPQK